MRLHRLELTAFGPFPDTVHVDFDTLSDASVFLLCGDTGAGKTTVLDGVCFALYGDVPSARGTAKQLRSHHAADGVAPRVVLELSLGRRRLRFTRSPAWQRPKKRGSGTTTEHARVVVEELDGDEWVLRTNRLDEAGQLVSLALGMTLTQFSQVVLLPQGQFDTFLRASSEDRQKVLTQLFSTGRFEQVERWFAQRRVELGREHRHHNALVAGVVHRIGEVSGSAHPDGWDLDDLTEVAAGGEVRGWAEGLHVAAARRRGDAAARLGQAAATRAATEAVVVEQRRRQQLLDRHEAALADQQALATGEARAQVDRDRLVAARRALPVTPLAEVATRARRLHDQARDASRAAVLALSDALGADPEGVRADDLGAREQEAVDRLARARAFLPRAAELREADRLRAETEQRAVQLAGMVERSRGALEQLPRRRAQLAVDLAAHRADAEQLPRLEGALERLLVQRQAASDVEAVTLELEEARAARTVQEEAAGSARERWLQLRERRLDGMAAELATALAVGQDCPVCGSVEHPSPAHAADGAPTREEEQQALKAVDDAQAALEVHRDRVRGLAARLDSARRQADGRSAAELAEQAAAVRARVESCREAAAQAPELEHHLSALDKEATTLTGRLARDQAELEAVRQRAAELDRTVQRLTSELAEILLGHDCLDDVITGHTRLRELLHAARVALEEESRRAGQSAEAATRLDEVARAAGFAGADEAAAAGLDDDELAALEASVRDRDRRERDVARVLADPEVRAAAAAPPDVAAAEQAHDDADREHTEAASALRLAEGVAQRLEARVGELDQVLAMWAPLRREYSLVRSLAELVDGKGSDNTRQMRLSAYVLASRLSQVVAAANERLARMSDGRYLLEHTDVRGVGERRGGLSLVVCDQWTDEQRDPVTLSGGETFVVSLALALGLADVVTAESGGTRIDTLFVDEGFGSLDAETLEQVMDTLDELRAGGRVVGVVSHVTEMRHRIPAQLRVVKARAGSRIEQVG
ncbi:MAG TPA: SMC family ATPase [Marmoricola sp.]|nr:SMC family ATPase [Marmoricola sp.]